VTAEILFRNPGIACLAKITSLSTENRRANYVTLEIVQEADHAKDDERELDSDSDCDNYFVLWPGHSLRALPADFLAC